MYDLESHLVANTLNNPIISAVVFITLLLVVYGLGIIIMDFIKGFNNKDA